MLNWLKKLFSGSSAAIKTIETDAQAARAKAMTSLEAFYAHVTGGVGSLEHESAEVKAYWVAEFATLHGYIAKLEASIKKAPKPAASAPIPSPVVVAP